jgi:hypothetical protein
MDANLAAGQAKNSRNFASFTGRCGLMMPVDQGICAFYATGHRFSRCAGPYWPTGKRTCQIERWLHSRRLASPPPPARKSAAQPHEAITLYRWRESDYSSD